MADIEHVGFLGAGGTMGLPMVRNLVRAGFSVRAWNRSRDKAEPLADDGASVVDTPREAIDGADAIVTMLADVDAIADSLGDGALDVAQDGAVWVQMSTVGIDGTERLQAIADDAPVSFVDAPVLGTKQPAEKGDLVVLASGPDADRDRLQPLFDAVGKKTLWAGEAGAGSRLKLVVNSWLLSVVEGAAEAIALAEAIDVDPGELLEAVAGGPVDLPYLQMKGKAMIERRFEPSFRLALAAKDARLVTEAAHRAGIDLPMLAAIARRFAEGAEQHGDEDMSATFLTSAAATAAR